MRKRYSDEQIAFALPQAEIALRQRPRRWRR
jgi:hypothetical protein